MTKRPLAALAALAVLFSGPVVAENPGHDSGSLNPKAPPETAQFSFLIGTWDCKTRFMGPDGTWLDGEATWTGYYILDGWAIQDDWVSRDGQDTFHGTNIRSFNPKTGRWDNRWLPQGALQWKYYQAVKVGETMVMMGGEGKDPRGAFVDRNTFHEIKPDSWLWRKERSYDNGNSWVEVGVIEARRRSH